MPSRYFDEQSVPVQEVARDISLYNKSFCFKNPSGSTAVYPRFWILRLTFNGPYYDGKVSKKHGSNSILLPHRLVGAFVSRGYFWVYEIRVPFESAAPSFRIARVLYPNDTGNDRVEGTWQPDFNSALRVLVRDITIKENPITYSEAELNGESKVVVRRKLDAHVDRVLKKLTGINAAHAGFASPTAQSVFLAVLVSRPFNPAPVNTEIHEKLSHVTVLDDSLATQWLLTDPLVKKFNQDILASIHPMQQNLLTSLMSGPAPLSTSTIFSPLLNWQAPPRLRRMSATAPFSDDIETVDDSVTEDCDTIDDCDMYMTDEDYMTEGDEEGERMTGPIRVLGLDKEPGSNKFFRVKFIYDQTGLILSYPLSAMVKEHPNELVEALKHPGLLNPNDIHLIPEVKKSLRERFGIDVHNAE